jgi:hypothetical protein
MEAKIVFPVSVRPVNNEETTNLPRECHLATKAVELPGNGD